MRRKFIAALTEIARRDPRVVLLTADLGYTVIEPFRDAFPDRFFNVGVAEQNMVGIATGLAESGFIPFVYSIGTFATARAYEFIRNGPILHHLPVRIIGVGGGYEYGSAGFSHHVLDDVGLMTLHGGIDVATPADAEQAVAALQATWNSGRPVYYRIGKDETYRVPGMAAEFAVGRAQVAARGERVLLVAMGAIAREAAGAVADLATKNMPCGLLIVSCVQPAPLEDFAAQFPQYEAVVTVEAHMGHGGLRPAVAQFIAERGLSCRLVPRAAMDGPDGRSGSEASLLKKAGLDRASLVELCAALWNERRGAGER